MSNLGFNPDNVVCVVQPNLQLLVQANTPLTEQDSRNTLSTLEMIEALDVARTVVLSHIIPYEIKLNRGNNIIVGTGKKYRKDKTFAAFWNDVQDEVEDAVQTHFTREVELSTGTKLSIHPMIRRVMQLVITPTIHEFSKHAPLSILHILDLKNEGIEGKDIFGYISRYLSSGDVELHPENILVARKVLQKKCAKKPPKVDRLNIIRNAVENLQTDKYE